MHITEQLLNNTIRIEAVINKTQIKTGSGMFFYLKTNLPKEISVIITNKHVVEGAKEIRLFFKKEKDNEPDYNSLQIVSIPNDSLHVVKHPNKDIDLVAIPVDHIYYELSKKNIKLYTISLNEDVIFDDSEIKKELKPIEKVWMIGYPNGLWDKKNNLPITREGITATSPYLDFNGKKSFLVDIAAFPGSSGSPLVYFRDLYTDKETYQAKMGTKLFFLGILSS
ncbi:serine protease, partial [Flavobacterium sp.]|uniref:S1 family peptidase n=1 Tax=Flavobacterium sp. TaxID=239 RepID=UPI00374CBCA2